MQLEELIHKRLTADEGLTKKLSRYNGAPSIFFQSAPGDTGMGWHQRRQYPRISYFIDMQANAERKSNGRLSVNVWCSEENGVMPEDIEPIVRERLCGIFLTTEQGETYSMEWARSDGFRMEESQTGQKTQIIGAAVEFDIFAFPKQLTTDPDPILAMNEYMRKICPECRIIGYDSLPEEYTPTANAPAFYWRLGQMGVDKVSWAVSWMIGIIIGHVFAPTTEDRLKWLQAAAQRMCIDQEAIMLDGSPMFFEAIRADSTADHLRSGQIQLRVKYGVLRKKEQAIYPLANEVINGVTPG